jgi:transcriptional regulator with PAS, ATPase and Fis domain
MALSDAPWLGVEALIPSGAAEPIESETSCQTLAEARYGAERRHIRNALESAGGRVDTAAKALGVSRSTLFVKMKKLDIRSEA